MSCPICKLISTYHFTSDKAFQSDEEFSSITLKESLRRELEDRLRKEGGSMEGYRHRSQAKLLSLFPVTPDLQPSKLHENTTTSAQAENTKAEQIVARRPREIVTGGLLLHIDYKPTKRSPADWHLGFPQVSENIVHCVNVMLGCRCNQCNEILASLRII